MMNTIHFLGRFHPLLLHLPIGFVLLAFVMELWRRWRRREGWEKPIRFALFLSMLSAIVAAALGYCLSLEGGYEAALLGRHQWAGFAAAALAVAAWRLRSNQRWAFPILTLNVVVITLAGHFGGMLTHGKQYLLEYAPAGISRILGSESRETLPAVGKLDSAVVYSAFIHPILERKCAGCHNPDKAKGRLLLQEAATLMKGGEHGSPIQPGKPWESLLVSRIILPETTEGHMPPQGLPQVSSEELALLQWWIAAGADTAVTASQVEIPEAILAILETKVNNAWRILARQATPPSARTLRMLQQAGIPVGPIAQESPLVEARLSYDTALTTQKLRMLRKIAPQLVSLDLSHTNAVGDMLDVLSSLPNLIELNLSHTAASDASLHSLRKARHLESLNLYGTAVTDAGLEQLKALPGLKKLYTWQSQATPAGIEALQRARPELEIWNGWERDTTFRQVQLKAPVISAEKELFEDSVAVALELNFGQVDIRYTLDGSEPDSSSLSYSGPIVLTKTTRLRTRAYKELWTPSEIADKQFVRVRYRPQAVALAKAPDERYSGRRGRVLYDFKKGTERFSDGEWAGWQGENVQATFDLGRVVPVSSVTVGALEDTGAWIFFPRGIAVWGSTDGKGWQPATTAGYPETEKQYSARTRNFTESFSPIEARYVKVEVKGQLHNPAWHPNPGGPSWVFLDEILVE